MNINTSLRKAYYDALKGICPTYYSQAPDDINYDAYIVLENIGNTEKSNKQNLVFDCSIQVKIYTIEEKINSGLKLDQIAENIYAVIKPNTKFNIALATGYQSINTKVTSDTIVNNVSKGNFVFLDRIITFTHNIKIN